MNKKFIQRINLGLLRIDEIILIKTLVFGWLINSDAFGMKFIRSMDILPKTDHT